MTLFILNYQLHYSVELKLDATLGENVELLFMGERASTVYVRSDRKIAKNTLMN